MSLFDEVTGITRRIDVRPADIVDEEGVECERCGATIPIGRRAYHAQTAPRRIERWCASCRASVLDWHPGPEGRDGRDDGDDRVVTDGGREGLYLNETDRMLLPHLREGRVTPVLAKHLIEEDGKEVSRPYVQQRLKRMEEHGHLRNLHDTGVYELVDDPELRADGGTVGSVSGVPSTCDVRTCDNDAEHVVRIDGADDRYACKLHAKKHYFGNDDATQLEKLTEDPADVRNILTDGGVDVEQWVLEHADEVRVRDGEPWSSRRHLVREARKVDGLDTDDVEEEIQRLVDDGDLLSWHGLLVPTEEERLREVNEHEVEKHDQVRQILIGKVNQALAAQRGDQ